MHENAPEYAPALSAQEEFDHKNPPLPLRERQRIADQNFAPRLNDVPDDVQ